MSSSDGSVPRSLRGPAVTQAPGTIAVPPPRAFRKATRVSEDGGGRYGLMVALARDGSICSQLVAVHS